MNSCSIILATLILGEKQEFNCTWKIILSFTSKSGCALRDCSIQIEDVIRKGLWYSLKGDHNCLRGDGWY